MRIGNNPRKPRSVFHDLWNLPNPFFKWNNSWTLFFCWVFEPVFRVRTRPFWKEVPHVFRIINTLAQSTAVIFIRAWGVMIPSSQAHGVLNRKIIKRRKETLFCFSRKTKEGAITRTPSAESIRLLAFIVSETPLSVLDVFWNTFHFHLDPSCRVVSRLIKKIGNNTLH